MELTHPERAPAAPLEDSPATGTEILVLPDGGFRIVGPDEAQGGRPVDMYLKRKAPNSKRTLRWSLDMVAAALSNGEADADGIPWHRVDNLHATHALDWIAARYSPSTTNLALAALRGVLRACWRLKLLSVEELHRAIDLTPVRGSRIRPGRDLAPGEIRALFQACTNDPSPAGARDAAAIAMLYGGGLRRVESVGVDLMDYSLETEELIVRSGKGNKDRITYVTGRGRDAIAHWLEHRGDQPGPILVPVTWSGRIHIRSMTDQAIYARLQKRATEAGVESFSPHDLRRTFAGDLLDAGVDLNTVKELMGHADPSTTGGYDRRGERTKRAGAKRLQIPYGD